MKGFSFKLNRKSSRMKNDKLMMLMILDGFGINEKEQGNAV